MMSAMTGCTLSSNSRYVVDEIHNHLGNMCLYELTQFGTSANRYERIYDTIGKYQIGDTVSFTLIKH